MMLNGMRVTEQDDLIDELQATLRLERIDHNTALVAVKGVLHKTIREQEVTIDRLKSTYDKMYSSMLDANQNVMRDLKECQRETGRLSEALTLANKCLHNATIGSIKRASNTANDRLSRALTDANQTLHKAKNVVEGLEVEVQSSHEINSTLYKTLEEVNTDLYRAKQDVEGLESDLMASRNSNSRLRKSQQTIDEALVAERDKHRRMDRVANGFYDLLSSCDDCQLKLTLTKEEVVRVRGLLKLTEREVEELTVQYDARCDQLKKIEMVQLGVQGGDFMKYIIAIDDIRRIIKEE